MDNTVILIPTYNERENIRQLVPRIFSLFSHARVIVIDDNSPDGTAAAVDELSEKYSNLSVLRRPGKEGLGKAYVHAFHEVLKDESVARIVMMDADLSHDPSYLPVMLHEAGLSDVVVGSRYVKGGALVGWELWRRMLSRFGNMYCRAVTGIPVLDCTTGFKLISAARLRSIDLSRMDASGYAFLMELKHALWKAGATFMEIPIVFRNRTGGESKLSNHIIREGIIAPWKMRLKN